MLSGDLLAQRLYELFGPVSMHLKGTSDEALMRGLHRRGIDAGRDGTSNVIFSLLDHEVTAVPDPEASSDHRYWAFYISETCCISRDDLDKACITRGLERAPICATTPVYDGLDQVASWWAIYQRRIPNDTQGDGILASLRQDAWDSISRYVNAASSIRPGDRVLVLGTERDGSRILTDLSLASEVITATREAAPDGIFDVIVDLEGTVGIEAHALVAQLRPAGVVITTGRRQWAGADLSPSSTIWQRTSRPRGFSADGGEIEICILRRPYLQSAAGFENKADVYRSKPAPSLDFGRYYVFPALIQTIVNMEHRIRDKAGLVRECHHILENVSLQSADAGAALCVLSYASERFRFAIEDARIQDYLTNRSRNPHSIRWQISLAYVRGEAFLSSGNFKDAALAFDTCLSFDARLFHLSILTKQIGACLKAANIAAAVDNVDAAADYLRRGTSLGREICGADPNLLFGTADDPRFFFFGEMAEALTLSSRCAYAYEHWKRRGEEGLRAALGRSLDLFRSPRTGDVAELAAQQELIDTLRRPLEEQFRAHAVTNMSAATFIRCVTLILMVKIASKIHTLWSRCTTARH